MSLVLKRSSDKKCAEKAIRILINACSVKRVVTVT